MFSMEILLCKPGGNREGPYTIEQINAGLLQKRFKDTDYWAWYEGLESWVPLHQVPGIVDGSKKATPTKTRVPRRHRGARRGHSIHFKPGVSAQSRPRIKSHPHQISTLVGDVGGSVGTDLRIHRRRRSRSNEVQHHHDDATGCRGR